MGSNPDTSQKYSQPTLASQKNIKKLKYLIIAQLNMDPEHQYRVQMETKKNSATVRHLLHRYDRKYWY